MAPTLSALLCFGLCLVQKMRAEADTLPRPSLRAENGPLVPQDRNVTLRCRGSWEGDLYRLENEQGYGRIIFTDLKPSGIEAKFPIPSVTANHTGTYSCRYKHSSQWSPNSDPLELVVTGLYDPPSLLALPSPEVASGQNVALQCQSEEWYDRCALYKDGQEITRGAAQRHGRGSQANFFIPAVNSTHEGTYRCYTFHSYYPQEWSFPSDPLVLRVTGTSKDPHLPQSPGNPQAQTSSPARTFSPSPESENKPFDPAPRDYTVGNLIRLSLAGLVLLLLGVLLAETWHSQRGPVSRSSRDP